MIPALPLILRFAVLTAFLWNPAGAAAQHDGDISIAALGNGLVLLNVPTSPLRVQKGFCAGGLCLYSATDVGLVTPSSPESPYTMVASGTALQLQVVAIEAGASVKVGSAVLDAADESASIGSAPGVHVHPAWQITAASDAAVERSISVRVIAPGGAYVASAVHQVTLATFDTSVTTTSTTTSTTTTSSTTSTTFGSTTTTLLPYCGDAIVDGTIGEDCDGGDSNGIHGSVCTLDCTWASCGDANHSGSLTAGDALFVLKAAVGSTACHACICQVRPGVDLAISASDALYLLRRAVGADVLLECPPCN